MLAIDLNGAGDLDIASHQIQKYFQKYGITPHNDPRYSSYFSNLPPEIALTYEWNTRFYQIKEFLNTENIARHNATLNPVASIKDRLFLMSMLWICLGTLPSIPVDINNHTIFIDILLNDQNSKDIKAELDAAELQYRSAPVHIVLGTRRVFSRAWCLYEIAIRSEARKGIQLLLARGEGATDIDQLPPVNIGPLTTVLMIFIRALWVPYIPMWLCGKGLRLCCRRDLARVSSLSEMVSIGTLVKVFHNFAAEEERGFACANFFETMTAFLESDKDAIKATALRVFGSASAFNAKLKSSVVRSESSALSLALIFWLEVIIWPLCFPVHLLSALASFLLAFLPLRLCCPCAKDGEMFEALRLSRWAAAFLQNWILLDIFLKPFLLSILAAPFLALVGLVRCGASMCRRGQALPPPKEAVTLLGHGQPAPAPSPASLPGGGAGAGPRETTSVRAYPKGFVPGFRVWTLEAYDGGELLVRVSRDMGSNQRKFKAFCEEVDRRGYELRPEHVMQVCDALYLHLQWDNSRVPFRGLIASI